MREDGTLAVVAAGVPAAVAIGGRGVFVKGTIPRRKRSPDKTKAKRKAKVSELVPQSRDVWAWLWHRLQSRCFA
jgi:hypothetical protein